MKTSNQS